MNLRKNKPALSQLSFRSKGKDDSSCTSTLNLGSANSNVKQSETRESTNILRSSTSLLGIDEFDDSFDLFLPRKGTQKPSSQSTSLAVKNKKSRYFDENGEISVKDDDLELALALSLQESEGTSTCVKPTVKGSHQPKGRTKHLPGQSLLMKRTRKEREQIVMEKVGIVLLDINRLPPLCSDQLTSLYSTHLTSQVDESKTLWNLSKSDFTRINLDKFYCQIILAFIPSKWASPACSFSASASSIPSPDQAETNSPVQDDLVDQFSSGEDQDSNIEEAKINSGSSEEDIICPSGSPSPKRYRVSQSPNSHRQNSVDNANDYDLSLRVDSGDIVEHLPIEVSSQTTEALFEDRTEHLPLLSSQLSSLCESGVSGVLPIHEGARTLYAHLAVIKARSLPLFQELVKNEKSLDGYPWATCRALLSYLYTGDLSDCLALEGEEREAMVKCCELFGLGLLLRSLSSKTKEVRNRVSKDTEIVILNSDDSVEAPPEEANSLVNEGWGVIPLAQYSDFPSNDQRTPRRSIDKYFDDSFPVLDNLKSGPTSDKTASLAPIVDCVTPGGRLLVSEVATPPPDYDNMVSPELKNALQRYGIKRGIGKRKAVTLLKYIYDQIHPPLDHPAMVKALRDVKETKTSHDSSSCEQNSRTSFGSQENLEIMAETHEFAESQSTQGQASLLRQIGDYIKTNTTLYAGILKYEPIWLNNFYQTVKNVGIKCNKNELIDVLDELGVIFRTQRTEQQVERRRNRKRRRATKK